jgi:hypothetical protein
MSEKARVRTFLIICVLLVYGTFVVREFRDYNFALYDPGWMVSTVMSIVEDGDLDLRNQLKHDPGLAADQIALGKDGQWFPLHEFVMPVVTVPFYFAFGIFGCLIFNIIISVLLIIAVFELCSRHVAYQSAWIAAALTAFTTLFLNYTYSYSLDVFGAFLLVVAYWCLVKRRFLSAGIFLGLATYARFANAVAIIGFVLFILLEIVHPAAGEKSGFKRILPVLYFVAGGLPAAVCFMVTNWLMFGSPTTTGYDRWLHFVNGQAVITQQSGAFSCSILENLSGVLMAKKSGLMTGAPLILVAVAFGVRGFWAKARNEAVLGAAVSVALIALFSMYCNAVPGEPGNRYLMPVVALCAIPLAFAVEQAMHPRNHND